MSGHPGSVQHGELISRSGLLIFSDFLFFTDETKECFGLLIGRLVSVVPTGHVAALYGKTSQLKQLS